jgi:hypothetical protein
MSYCRRCPLGEFLLAEVVQFLVLAEVSVWIRLLSASYFA